MKSTKKLWSDSKTWRILLILAIIYGLVRLAAHSVFLGYVLESDETGWHDLQVYEDAAQRLIKGENLYPQATPDWIEFYQYSPLYALVFVPFLWLPDLATMGVFTLLHLGAYAVLYWRWQLIFRQLQLDRARQMLIYFLPLWIVFAQFWADLSYLNIYIFMALLSTLLIESILKDNLELSVLWLSIILQAKPQWAFPTLLPLILGRYRFFLRLIMYTILAYASAALITIAILGWTYGPAQYADYVRLLLRIQSGGYPWRTPEASFLGYNHSIKQIMVYLFGASRTVLFSATVLKIMVLLPLAGLILQCTIRPIRLLAANPEECREFLDFAFALYLGAFIWLDVVWELTLGIIVFIYLMATLKRMWTKSLSLVAFLPYAFRDVWQLLSVAVFSMDQVLVDAYVLTDPSIYVPITMLIILTFYTLMVRRIWTTQKLRTSSIPAISGARQG